MCPCDKAPYECPYNARYEEDCACYCHTGVEVSDDPSLWEDEPYDLDMGFDPYTGCYTDDC